MKPILTTFLLLLVFHFGNAQQGNIQVKEEASIGQLLGLYKESNTSSAHYRIQVFFGPYDKAKETLSDVESDFPQWPAKIDFESPSYRVRLGRFKNQLDAERNLMEVRQKYPGAMLLKPKKTTS